MTIYFIFSRRYWLSVKLFRSELIELREFNQKRLKTVFGCEFCFIDFYEKFS